MTKPQILMPNDCGIHNSNLENSTIRLNKTKLYDNISTIIVVPTRGGPSLTPRWVTCLNNLMKPMNQQIFGPMFLSGMEVGVAYNEAIQSIFNNPVLNTCKYMLTWEDDVLPPPDGLLKLYEGMDKFDCIGALYWTKGEEGQPMIYGDINDPVVNFRPQLPQSECLQRTYGLGMGFNLFKLDIFRKLEYPWFETVQRWDANTCAAQWTQDLSFFHKAGREGFKFACNTKVRAGHFSHETDIVW